MATRKRPSKKASAPSGTANDKFIEALRDYIRAKGAQYLQDPNLSSVGIGYKVKDGKRTNELAIQFTVEKKVRPDVLESLGTEAIPETINVQGVEVPTDVIERKFTAEYRVVPESDANQRKIRLNPIVPGVSVSHVRGTAGTIACIVYDNANGTPYILSNWHVLHTRSGAIGDDIVQPGPFDDNRTNRNLLGKLVRSHLGEAGDCAIATIADREWKSGILDLDVAIDQLGEPALDDKVIKSGRTTGVTHGIVTRIHVITKINYGGSIGEKAIGGFEIGLDPAHPPFDGEVSKPGDSGAAWLFKAANGKPTRIFAGLHFAGEADGDPFEHAVACYPKSVFEKLQISLTLPAPAAPEAIGGGYSRDFLSTRVPVPSLSTANKAKAVKLNGSEVIEYTHFSLALHSTRKLPMWVAWNIDGGSLKKLSRNGIPFIRDPRLPANVQAGDELYAGNRLDRGHIARRADLLWGPLAEAKKANVESFFFTNITPQMDDFNQGGLGGLWGKLEDAVFADTEVEDLKVSVFGGPVFRPDDRTYRGVQIPRDFWKLIVFVENNQLKAKAFVLTQNLDALETLDLDEFKVFQVAISDVESRIGVTFPDVLKSADTVAESVSAGKLIESLHDIDWS